MMNQCADIIPGQTLFPDALQSRNDSAFGNAAALCNTHTVESGCRICSLQWTWAVKLSVVL